MTDSSQLPRVLITHALPDDVLAPLRGVAELIPGPIDGSFTSREHVLNLAPTLAGIISQAELRVDAELLDRAPNLRIAANIAAGYNNLDTAEMARRGVWATNAASGFTNATADVTMALITSVARFIVRGDRFIREGKWTKYLPLMWDGTLLEGLTLGIVGYGAIGKAVARRARAHEMRVIYTRQTPSDEPDARALDSLLAEADVVSLHVPLTASTRHLIDRDALAKMKPGAFLINMARGAVMDEQAVVDALRSGRLAGAGLDVFEDEPRVHPALPAMDNVVLTPHLGGCTHVGRRQSRLLASENVARVLRGEPPLTPVNAPV